MSIHPRWQPFFDSQADFLNKIDSESDGLISIPAPHQRFRAFEQDPAKLRVLILGQDPYPNPLHASGLAFSVPAKTAPLPKSLQNIFQELHADLGKPLRTNGDLQDWANQGVWLLNSVLTTEIGNSNAHSNLGWEQFTKSAIKYVIGLGNLRVAVLWGNAAKSMANQLESLSLIQSAHPSPLSAYRGFFGSKPFSRANQYLLEANLQPIEWG